MKNSFKTRFLALCISTVSFSGIAESPTAAQMAQFKSLPKAQQEQLARQYGIDLNTLPETGQAVSDGMQEMANAPERIMQKIRTAETDTEASAEAEAEDRLDDDELKAFGYDVLLGEPQGFTAVDNIPVPLDYVVESGDELKVQLYGKTNQEFRLKVDREGKVYFPEFGPVAVSGQSFAQIREQIKQLVEQKVLGVDVVVTMGNMRTMQVYIVGETTQPGAYNVNGLTTMTQALVASGGIKETGSLRNIQLKRKGEIVATLDLYTLLMNGDTSSDVRLRAGDTLFIPTKSSTVAVDGQVLRPAIYELSGSTSLERVLSLSGGMLPQAYLSKISVRRQTASGQEQFTLDITQSSGLNFMVKSGDEIE